MSIPVNNCIEVIMLKKVQKNPNNGIVKLVKIFTKLIIFLTGKCTKIMFDFDDLGNI